MLVEPARMTIARRAALELKPGEVVNLGAGIPNLVVDVIGDSKSIFFHSENGVLGFGPSPPPGEEDEDLVDAGKRPITEKPGICYFHSADSFAMIRGGHIDCVILGTLQVDQKGYIANWMVPGRPQLGVGGAMDLLAGARRVIVATTISTGDGQPKILKRCTLPITAYRQVDMIITEVAVFHWRDGRLILKEVAPKVTVSDVRKVVEAEFDVAHDIKEFVV